MEIAVYDFGAVGIVAPGVGVADIDGVHMGIEQEDGTARSSVATDHVADAIGVDGGKAAGAHLSSDEVGDSSLLPRKARRTHQSTQEIGALFSVGG